MQFLGGVYCICGGSVTEGQLPRTAAPEQMPPDDDDENTQLMMLVVMVVVIGKGNKHAQKSRKYNRDHQVGQLTTL